MKLQTSGTQLSSVARRALGLILLQVLLLILPVQAGQPEQLIERRMDPSLRLLYRAAKGKGSMGLARAAEVHKRLHAKKGKGKGNGNGGNSNPRLELLVRYAGPQRDLEAAGFEVQAKVGEVFTGTLAMDRLVELAELPRVRVLQSSTTLLAHAPREQAEPSTVSSKPDEIAGVSRLRSIQPFDASGTGVLVAFIDTGADVFHDDLRRSDGSTRIRYLLDFSEPGDVDGDGDLDGTGPYGGTLYTEIQINAAIGAGTFAQRDTTGHGTHGLSIAAGDDGTLPGGAPAANLIVVKATREDGTLAFTSADIINALAFVDSKAAELGMPYVANLSLGTLFSSHDGRSLEEQAIDALVGPGVAGKAIVVAAGNASDNRGTLKRHFGATTYVGIPVNQTLSVPAYTANSGKGNDRIVLDLWYEGNDKLTLKVTSPNGHIVMAPYGDYADQQTPDGDVFIANLGGANPENGDIEAIVLIDDWTGPAPQAGTWTVSVEGTEIGATGEFHAWLAEDSVVGTASPALAGSADNRLLVGKPGGAYNALTVGSYARHLPGTRFRTSWTDVNGIVRTDSSAIDGDISSFSSPGKTRDGRVKPEITAPGERTMGAVSRDALPGVSATSIYRYHSFTGVPNALLTDSTTNHAFGMLEGTSFSAPVVTGLVARILSTNPALDAIQVRNILINTATADAFTGAVPNDVWGYGKAEQSVGTTTPLPNDLRIVPDTLPTGVRNQQYNFVLTASGGTLPYNWFVAGGALPPGLTLESRGFLSGKPTTAGSYPVTIQVTDSSAPIKTVAKTFTVAVASAANVRITSAAHPVGHLDKEYKSVLSAEGGTPPYGWTLAGGSLPPGLTLGSSGSITGTPTLTGSYPFTVQVQDAASATDLRSGRIKVTTAGAGDWSVLGKSVPTVTGIVVDPNDPNRVVAATTGIDAIFESTNAGESWHPISINNGLNATSRTLSISPANSEILVVQKTPECDWICRYTKYYAGGAWSTIGSTNLDAAHNPDGIAIGASGTVYGGAFIGNNGGPLFYSSTNHQPWAPVSSFAPCGNSYFGESTTSIGLAGQAATIYWARGTLSDLTLHGLCASLDGGITWSDVRNGSSGFFDLQVSSSDANDVLKAGSMYVERTLDGGRNWTTLNLTRPGGPPGPWRTQLRRSRTNPQIVIAGHGQGFFKSVDGGASWTSVPILASHSQVTAVAVDPTDADTLFVAGIDGVRRSRDGGVTWTNVSSGLVRRVLGDVRVSSASPTDVAIASAEGPFLSRTSGHAWTKSTPGMSSVLTRRVAISGADANLYFAGTDSAVYRSTNRGVTWTQVDGGVANGYPVMALDADPSDASYVLFSLSGTRGTYRSIDGGLTFASANVGLPYGTANDLSFARDAANAGRVYIALTTDGLYRSENRGATWSAFGLNTQTTRAVEPAPTDSNYVYAAGATQMYFLDPAIGTWQAATVGPVNPILSLAVDANNKLIAYAGADHPGTPGNTGGLYKTTNGGRNWTRLAGILDQLDVVALAAHPSTSGVLWAATLNGGVFRTDDGGVTWKELGNYGTVADLTNVNIQDPSNPFLLFAGTEGYGVQASTDSGKTFIPRVTGLGNLYVNAVAFDPEVPTTLYAATDSGVYKSTNSGNNWAATPLTTGEVTDIVTDNEGTGKRIWATVAGQGVAYSPDAGATFTTYSTGLASLQLTSLEVEIRGTGKRIWATTKGGDGIAYSDNLGLSWTSSAGNGLTDRDINDLAIQSGTGKRIWATANSGVFVSADDGLSWRDISIGLPSGIPATSVSIDPNSGETLVSLFSEDGGGVYRGGSVNGAWREYSAGLTELKVKKLTRGNGYSINPSTLGARFYAATAGDGVYSTVLETNITGGPVVSTYRLPRGLLRESYAAALAATGGSPPYTWSLTDGSLPAGLGLNTATGAISGEPGVLGIFTFTVRAADANQRTGSKELSIEVVSPDSLQVTQCTPNLGVRGETLNVTVHGSGFVATPSVSFGAGAIVNSVTFVSASQLTVNLTLDSGAIPGYRTVTVTNPSSASASLPDGFKLEYPTPVVSGVAPATGSRKETLNVVVNGTNFESGATVSFGEGVTVNSVTPGSSTSLTANVTISSSAGLGTRNVTVTNVNGFSGTLAAAFTVRAAKPVLTSTSPAQGNQGATFNVTLTGDDFQSGASSSFGAGVTVSSTSFVSATQLSANITISSTAGLGYRTVTVTNPDSQSVSLNNGLRVMGPPPQVLSASPAQGILGQTLGVTLTGTGLQTGAVVSFGAGVTVHSATVVSSTQISANVTVSASATPGTRTVTVTNLDGQVASKTNGFEVRALAPVLTSVTPAGGARGATLNVTLGGSEFRSGATASFGADVTVNSFVVSTPTQATAGITIGDAAALGARGVTLTNPDGQASTLASSFTIRDFAPSVVSVEPASLGPCASGQLVVKGYYFRPGTTISFGTGVVVNGITVESNTSLTASVSVEALAQSGTRSVTVTNPDGQSGTTPSLFQISAPTYATAQASYSWVDASAGTDTGISGDDAGAAIPIGFSFPFAGNSYTSVTVSSNGYLTFGGSGTAFENVAIPTASQPNNLIAVYWDDLRVIASSGSVKYQLLGAAPTRRLVVQWSGVTTTSGTNAASFQAILHEIDGSILLQYQDVTFGDPLHDGAISATIGAENGAGNAGVQISHNTAGLTAGSAYLIHVPACSPPPSISIGDVSVTEGNSGTSNTTFPVTLSRASTSTVTVSYTTVNGSATAGSDYTESAGTTTFVPGEISRNIEVPVLGDATYEPNETFKVTLSNPTNATIADAEAVGTITNDDAAGPLVPPTGVVAVATTTSSVNITWNAVAQATYQIYRSASGTSYGLIGSTGSTVWVDATALPATSYLYAVKAVDASNTSGYSAPDVATTVLFTDAIIVAGTTIPKAAHITELRVAVNAVRTLAGLDASTFTDQQLSSVTIKRVHLTELRTALDTARSGLGLLPVSYSDPTIVEGATIIKAAHVTDLREAVK